MHDDQMLLGLCDKAACDRRRAGSKAATLARLRQAGFPVPDGTVLAVRAFQAFVAGGGADSSALPAALRPALGALAKRYAGTPVAVRSSALAEDQPDATFAGQYETVLDVRGPAAIEDAVRRCWSSVWSAAASAYRRRVEYVDEVADQAIAVLIQPMVVPDAAGVALGADPLTGDRACALVSAVRGLAAPLVSGQVTGEEWEVRDGQAVCRRALSPGVLTAAQASAVVTQLRLAEELLGGPQDMEWALADGHVHILQARPMTALPAGITWPVPPRGVWSRSIRLGEWLPEPVTPLFDTWLLHRLEEQFRLRQRETGGISAPPPLHVCVHSWYFHSPIGSGRQSLLFRGMLRRPRLAVATVLASRWPRPADRLFFREHLTHWQRDVLAPYQRAVADAERRAPGIPAAEIPGLIDQLADLAGDFFWSFVLCGGAAWRFEIALARFYQRHLRHRVSPSYQVLLGGLGFPDIPGHAVHSLDWLRETAGQDPARAGGSEVAAIRHKAAADERLAAETACRQALAPEPKRQAQFANLLDLAQRYARSRAEHAQWFTLAWPVMRQCVRRLGAMMASAGLLDQAEDVFFVSRAELDEYVAGGRPQLSARAADRRAAWERDRRLVPPLVLGKPPLLLAKVLLSSPKAARPAVRPTEGALRGTPASPGSAAGPVRVVRDPAGAGVAQPGDVLVVSAATPALTSVFDRIAALCVDNGSVAAHASLVAREYGIPAVTGLGDATARLTDGMWVFVDGTAGIVDVR